MGQKLGLASRTEIELTGEAQGTIGGQQDLYDNTKLHNEQATSMPGLVFRSLCKTLRGYQTVRGVEIDEAAIENAPKGLCSCRTAALRARAMRFEAY